jgi:hypothetical protein
LTATNVIDNLSGDRMLENAVDREIASKRVVLRRTETDSARTAAILVGEV